MAAQDNIYFYCVLRIFDRKLSYMCSMIQEQEQERGSQISFYLYGTHLFPYGKCKQPFKVIFGFKVLPTTN